MRRSVVPAVVCPLLLVGGHTAAVAADGGGRRAEGQRTVTVAAPCEGRADVSLRLISGRDEDRGPTYVVRVTGARPGSRWLATVNESTGGGSNSGTVAQVRADRDGTWRLRGRTVYGFVELTAGGQANQGQSCEVTWKGVFQRRPRA